MNGDSCCSMKRKNVKRHPPGESAYIQAREPSADASVHQPNRQASFGVERSPGPVSAWCRSNCNPKPRSRACRARTLHPDEHRTAQAVSILLPLALRGYCPRRSSKRFASTKWRASMLCFAGPKGSASSTTAGLFQIGNNKTFGSRSAMFSVHAKRCSRNPFFGATT